MRNLGNICYPGHPIEIAPAQWSFDWGPAPQIMFASNNFAFITQAGSRKAEIVMTVTTDENELVRKEILLVEQRYIVALGRPLPEPLYSCWQGPAPSKGATPEVVITEDNDNGSIREYSAKFMQHGIRLGRHCDISRNHQCIGPRFAHPLCECLKHGHAPRAHKVKIRSNEQLHLETGVEEVSSCRLAGCSFRLDG